MIEHNRVYVVGGDEGPEAEVNEAVLWNKQDGRQAEYVASFDVTELLADALAFRMLNSIVGISEAVVHREAMGRMLKLLPEDRLSLLAPLAAIRVASLLETDAK